MEQYNQMGRNYRILRRILTFSAVILLIISRRFVTAEPEKRIIWYIGIGLLAGAIILAILFLVKPDSFRDKAPNPDDPA
jgi:hypothetical protein